MPPTPWLNFPQPHSQATFRLFCLPYAGGSAVMFRSWPNHFPESVEICSVQLPGRGARLKEVPFRRIQELVPLLAEAVKPYLDKPFAIFGYSLGAVIGFELTRHLRQTASASPGHLFVAGRRAPQVSVDRSPRYALPDEEFISELRKLNGTPEEVLEHPELVQLMLPSLRADFELDETYVYRSETPLDVPLSAYGGLADPDVTREHLQAWREQTTSAFELMMFPGDHFFLHTGQSLLFQAINRRLADMRDRL